MTGPDLQHGPPPARRGRGRRGARRPGQSPAAGQEDAADAAAGRGQVRQGRRRRATSRALRRALAAMADLEVESRGGAGGVLSEDTAPCARSSSPPRAASDEDPRDHVAGERESPARLAVPADRGLRLPVGLRDLRAGRAQRRDRVDVPAALRRPERVRRAAGPRRRHVPARPGGHDGAGGAALPAGHDDPRDVVGHEPRLADRPRRAARRPVARHRRALARPTAARPPTTTPTTSCCARSAASTARSRSRWSATRSSTTAAATPSGSTSATATARRWRRAEGWPTKLHADDRPARRLRGLARARGQHAARRRHRVRRARVLRPSRARRPTRTPTTGWSRPPTTGTSGSPTARSRTIRGASTCSAARSRSRASATRRPAR